MEYQFYKEPLGYSAQCEYEQELFAVLLTDELQELSLVEAVLALVDKAQSSGEEQRWQGRQYVLQIADDEVQIRHNSEMDRGYYDDDFQQGESAQSDYEGDEEAHAAEQDPFSQNELSAQSMLAGCGLEDFTGLLQAWHEFIH